MKMRQPQQEQLRRMVEAGTSTGEIAAVLNVSRATVCVYRVKLFPHLAQKRTMTSPLLDEVIRMHAAGERTCVIAEKTGLPATNIVYWIRKLKLPKRPHDSRTWSLDDIAAAKAMRDRGQNLKAIAEHFGVSYSSMHSVCGRAGINTRKNVEWAGEKVEKLRRMWDAGKSIRAIAGELEMPERKVASARHRFNLSTRHGWGRHGIPPEQQAAKRAAAK